MGASAALTDSARVGSARCVNGGSPGLLPPCYDCGKLVDRPFNMDAENMEAMQVALRVLRALNEMRRPEAADEEALRKLRPLSHDLPLDALARQVIEECLHGPSRDQRPAGSA
jgi:hypothetical protein